MMKLGDAELPPATAPPRLRGVFYGDVLGRIHHERFGDLAAAAARRLIDLLREAGHRDGHVYDLGCGSGILAREVADAGYDVTGFDLSPAMVELARSTARGATFHVRSVHDVELGSAVGVTAVGEVLNYAADPAAGLAALAKIAAKAHAALHSGGVLMFDVAMPGRHGTTPRVAQFHDHPTWSLGMNAVETDDGTTLDRVITVFARDASGDSYRRFDEHHVLRLYRRDDVERVLGGAGFDVEVTASYDAEPTRSTPAGGWAVFIARKG